MTVEDRASLVDDVVPPHRPRDGAAAPHDHVWRLVSVEYEDSGPVRELTCERCAEVRFA